MRSATHPDEGSGPMSSGTGPVQTDGGAGAGALPGAQETTRRRRKYSGTLH